VKSRVAARPFDGAAGSRRRSAIGEHLQIRVTSVVLQEDEAGAAGETVGPQGSAWGLDVKIDDA